MIKEYGSSESSEREEAQAATCSRPQIAPGHDYDFSESSEDESPLEAWSSALRNERGEKGISSSDSSELSYGEDPQETSSSALRSGSDTMDAGNNSALEELSGKRSKNK
ncbi:PREDICTED: nuclear autoantigen Sp-100-like [Propithecus coquereli]|uniref:nuclear autoantigen Sp-100-like n=1 Tax=Propithecus coquereli TaxID=379532 RepID=UPI00063F84BD|nr:PREDICTED: nuclear autoantigen Sp-100-like [Propithecus coquereli]